MIEEITRESVVTASGIRGAIEDTTNSSVIPDDFSDSQLDVYWNVGQRTATCMNISSTQAINLNKPPKTNNLKPKCLNCCIL